VFPEAKIQAKYDYLPRVERGEGRAGGAREGLEYMWGHPMEEMTTSGRSSSGSMRTTAMLFAGQQAAQ
jgi:hypothetical protein